MKKISVNRVVPLLSVFTMLILMTASSANATTGISDSIKTELRKVSEQLYKDGNQNFIITDAIIDGIILPGQYYKFTYRNEEIRIDDNEVPIPLRAGYLQKMKAFDAVKGSTVYNSMKSCSGVTFAEIFDPNSSFRKETVYTTANPHYKRVDSRPLIALMVKDNIIDSADYL